MNAPHEIHNEAAGQIVRQLVFPTLQAGGDISDVMVLTESCVLGVVLFCEKLGADKTSIDIMLESLVDEVRARWLAIRAQGPAA